jgi:hypothetical protein
MARRKNKSEVLGTYLMGKSHHTGIKRGRDYKPKKKDSWV